MSDVSETILTAFQKIHGSEISISGAIGIEYDKIRFCDNTGVYWVKLDAGRDARRQIEECKFECDFSSPSENECQISGMAEIEVQWDDGKLGRGIPIHLIIYEAEVTRRD